MPVPRTYQCSSSDSTWLRAPFERALRCAVVSSLSLAACAPHSDARAAGMTVGSAALPSSTSSAGPPCGSQGTIAGARRQPWAAVPAGILVSLPPCTDAAGWSLAAELTPSRPVDFLADRDGEGEVLSSTGAICSGATQRADCDDAVLVLQQARHLLTTEGDEVRLWDAFGAPALLRPIDTVAEAVWLLIAQGYKVHCGTMAGMTESGFQVGAVQPSGSRELVQVDSDGGVVVLPQKTAGDCPRSP